MKVLIIGSREPNGITWLANCLLELGIRVYRRTSRVPEGMWLTGEGGVSMLHPKEAKLKKWLPALSRHDSFRFEDGIEIEWCHDWPKAQHLDTKILYFVRDPRDSLFSRYRREQPGMGFDPWLDLLETGPLTDKISGWCIFNQLWLDLIETGGCEGSIVRFEDYKTDAMCTLKNALAFIGVQRDESALNSAIVESTSEKAMEAERSRCDNADSVTVNRGGIVGQWKEQSDSAFVRIAFRAAPILARLGYLDDQQATPSTAVTPEFWPTRFFWNASPFFKDIALPPRGKVWLDTQQNRRLEMQVLDMLLRVASVETLALNKCFFYGANDMVTLLNNLMFFSRILAKSVQDDALGIATKFGLARS